MNNSSISKDLEMEAYTDKVEDKLKLKVLNSKLAMKERSKETIEDFIHFGN